MAWTRKFRLIAPCRQFGRGQSYVPGIRRRRLPVGRQRLQSIGRTEPVLQRISVPAAARTRLPPHIRSPWLSKSRGTMVVCSVGDVLPAFGVVYRCLDELRSHSVHRASGKYPGCFKRCLVDADYGHRSDLHVSGSACAYTRHSLRPHGSLFLLRLVIILSELF